MLSIGTNLKICRKEKGLRQEEIAERVGITQGLYSRYENDAAIPTAVMMKLLADIFGVPVGDLYKEIN